MSVFEAMQYARLKHAGQVRKYTGAPYVEHCAEVAGIVGAALENGIISRRIAMSVAWLHDTLEDTNATYYELLDMFGSAVAVGVSWLSDLETGNRAERKAASRARLAQAPEWVQTIKVADLISNTASIVLHDPDFAKVYLEEKRLLLQVLTGADGRLVAIAREQIQ